MTRSHSCYLYFVSLLTLALTFTLAVSLQAHAAEVNNGTVEYTNPDNTRTAPDGYENRGDLTATSTATGVALTVTSGGFANYGNITASSGGIGIGIGIFVDSGGFANYGLLTLAGTGRSIGLSNTSGNDIRLLSGSILALGGGYIDMGGPTTLLYSQPGAQVISLEAAAGDRVSSVSIFRSFRGATNGAATSAAELERALNLANGPVLGYSVVDNGSGSYDIATTRHANASDFVGGNAGDFVGQLESALNGQSLTALTGPLHRYALMRSYIDSQPTVQDVQATAEKAAIEYTPQGTANSAVMLTRNARIAQQTLSDKMQSVGNLNATATAPASGDVTNGFYFFGQPFYHHGELDGRSGYSDITEKVFGGSIGVLKAHGPWVFGLSGHTFRSDIDGGYAYDADATGYGVNLGLGRSFRLGSLNPFVELTGGWTFVELDQTRRTSMLAGIGGDYDSDVDMNIYTASFTISNRFALGDNFSITPRLGVDYAYTDIDSYSESSGVHGLFDLDVSGSDYTSFRSVAGLTFGYSPLPSLHLEARADYYHEFADTSITLNSRFKDSPLGFSTKSQDTGRDFFRVGGGLSWTPTDAVNFTLSYDFTTADRYQGHDVAIQTRIVF